MTPTRAGARQLPNGKGKPESPGRRPRRCAICHQVGTEGNPLSGRGRHLECAVEELAAWQEWAHLWNHRTEADFAERVAAFVSRYQEGCLPPAIRAA